jgi:hypothetical protein
VSAGALAQGPVKGCGGDRRRCNFRPGPIIEVVESRGFTDVGSQIGGPE